LHPARIDKDADQRMPENIDPRKNLHQPEPWPSRFPLDQMRARFDRPQAIFNATHGVRLIPLRISDPEPAIARTTEWPLGHCWRNS
jgi:hypothetical protein